MKQILIRCLAAVSVLGFIAGDAGAASQEVVFGLTNRAINGATLERPHYGGTLSVSSLSTYGYKGVSVRLGEADSGLFFSPGASNPLENDYFMSGHAFGRVGGVDRRLSSVVSWRREWATYPIVIDLLPLGSLSKTIQLFVDDVFIGEEAYTDGEIIVSTSSSDSIGPRVNPFWRMPDGSVGVLIEFSGFPPLTLPSGRSTYANRIFVRADSPLFTVSHVTHVEVYGGGGLPTFSAQDQRLGAFGRAHRALGNSVFSAKKNRLTLAGNTNAGQDGVMMELKNDTSFRAGLRPVSLAESGDVFLVSATSSHDPYNYYMPAIFLGPAGIENVAGAKQLTHDFPATGATETRVEVFHGSSFVGALMLPHLTTGSFGTNELAIVAAGATGGSGSNLAGLFLELREPATLTANGQSLVGNLFHLSPANPTNDIGTFSSFQLHAAGVDFTITNETATPTPPHNLALERAGTNVVVSWPGSVSGFSYLERTGTLTLGSQGEVPWQYVADQHKVGHYRSRVLLNQPFTLTNNFYRLRNPYLFIYQP